jgi:TM2 domain-containing membrane protein YozV
MRTALFTVFFLVALHSSAQRSVAQRISEKVLFKTTPEGVLELRGAFRRGDNVRLVAIALDVTLGLFGTHRMYLGTDLKVPVFYSLTVGGACVLWVVDLGLLIFSRDITPYMDNPNIFMWNTDRPATGAK